MNAFRLTDAVLASFEAVVGADQVRASDAVEGHEGPYGLTDALRHRPSAAVMPASVEGRQAVLLVAHDHGVPLWTASTGKTLDPLGIPWPGQAGRAAEPGRDTLSAFVPLTTFATAMNHLHHVHDAAGRSEELARMRAQEATS